MLNWQNTHPDILKKNVTNKAGLDRLSLSVMFLLLSLIVPSSLSADLLGIRISAHRLILILAMTPVLSKYFALPTKHSADKFVFITSFLMIVTMAVNSGMKGTIFGASLALETLFPYLMARVYVTKLEHFVSVQRIYVFLIAILILPVSYEAIKGTNIFTVLFGGDTGKHEMRLGFYRSAGPMDHPILFGIFSAAGLSLTQLSTDRRWLKRGLIALATFASLSSAGFVMFFMQAVLLWKKKMASAKLSTYLIAIISVYILIDMLSNRSPLAVMASYLSLDKQTAHFRLLIYESAIKNVLDNLFMGIGLNGWVRPEWMPPSIDNFFMLVAVRHGVLTVSSILMVIWAVLQSTYAYNSGIHIAFRILVLSMVFAIFTVHIWNSVYVFFWFILGITANLKFISFKLP